MLKNIMITAGGTSEAIDGVRKITNTSTGSLGSAVEEAFSRQYPDIKITYVAPEKAVEPDIDNMKRVYITDVHSVLEAIHKEFFETEYDAVIHAMAVSDYTVSGSIDSASLAKNIYDAIKNKPDISQDNILKILLDKNSFIGKSGKMSSNIDNPMIVLEKTPKIISFIKKAQPETTLVGFKLLNGVSEDHLIDIAHDLLLKNSCDFVLANDLKKIKDDTHVGHLVKYDKSYETLSTKEEIAEAIVQNVARYREDK